jgi:hypothetical protein
MAKQLKNAIHNLIDDLAQIETVMVNTETNEHSDLSIYSKVELGGDLVNYIHNDTPKELIHLHSELLKLSFKGRSAYWNFFKEALS